MSDLADLLAGRVAAGAYRWSTARPVEDVRAAVEAAGWRFAHLDEPAASKAALLDALGPALGLTGFHGRNLDALEECVRELPGPTLLLWDAWGTPAGADPRSFRLVTEVLTETHDRPGCWVLLRGEGPELGLAALA